jgi:hypothetical protein
MNHAGSYILFPTGADDAPAWLVARAGPKDVAAVAPVHLAGGANAEEVACSIVEALGRLGHAGQGVTLAIPSGWCMSVSIETGGAQFDRKARLFKLEEKVPLAVEELVADFAAPVDGAGPQPQLAVCARVDALRPWLEALERAGVPIESVTPAALLAAGAAVRATETATDGSDTLLLVKEGDDVCVVSLNGSRAVAWNLAHRSADGIALQVRLIAYGHPVQHVLAFGLSSAELASVDAGLQVTVVDADADVMSLATSYVGTAPHASRLELRRGPLAVADRYRLVRGSLNAALAAAAVFLLCISGALLLRAQRYDRQAAGASADAAQAFREAFPDWPMPASIRALVESEHRKLVASSAPARIAATARGGDGENDHALPRPNGSALATLLQVLAAVPGSSESARFRLDRLSFEAERFDLEGDAATAEVVDDLVTACRVAGLPVTSPEMRKSPGGASWTFVLRGGPSPAGVARGSP